MRFVTCAVASATLSPVFALAQTGIRPLEIEDAVSAIEFHLRAKAAVSPDGSSVAYVACDPKRVKIDPKAKMQWYATDGAPPHSMGCDVWLAGGTAPARNLTAGQGNSWAPTWSPDGRRLVFQSDRDGAPRLWVWEAGWRSPRRLSPAVLRSIASTRVQRWTPDGRQLVVQLRPAGMTDAELSLEATSPLSGQDEATKTAGSTVAVFRPRPRRDTAGAANAAATAGTATALDNRLAVDLAVIDASSGRARTLASRLRVDGLSLSPDGRRVALAEYVGRSRSRSAVLSDFVIIDLTTGARRVVATKVPQDVPAFHWSPDGRELAYTAGEHTAESLGALLGDAFVVAVEGGAPRRLDGAPANSFSARHTAPLWDSAGRFVYLASRNRLWRGDVARGTLSAVTADTTRELLGVFEVGETGRVWSGDGGTSVYVATFHPRTVQGGYAKIAVESGARTQIVEGDNRYNIGVVSADGRRVVYEASSVTESEDLWIAGPDFAGRRRLTDLNPRLSRYTFGTGRLVNYLSTDGEPLRGALLLPAGYREGTRYPLVVWVYASSIGSAHLNRFGLVGIAAYNMHMLTTRGYAVLWPDVPVHVGTPMQDMMKGVMPAIDKLVELGIADPDRLAVMGQSNGGYSTLALITQTNRFKAAVMNAGFGDLTAFYGAMTPTGENVWIPWLEDRGGSMGVPPWEAPLRYVQNSPIYYLDRVTTPLVIQAGGADVSIVPFSDQVYVGLSRLGKDVTYLRYAGESHVLQQYPNLVDYWNRVIAFLGERLGQTVVAR